MTKNKYFILLDKTGNKSGIKIDEIDDTSLQLLMDSLKTEYIIEECTPKEYKKLMRKLGEEDAN